MSSNEVGMASTSKTVAQGSEVVRSGEIVEIDLAETSRWVTSRSKSITSARSMVTRRYSMICVSLILWATRQSQPFALLKPFRQYNILSLDC